MSEFDFSQDFNRKGEAVNYYGPGYEIGVENKPSQIQGSELVNELKSKFGSKISNEKIYKWKAEMVDMESFEFMNCKFVAVALILLDNYAFELNSDSFFNVFKQIFKNETIMEPYYEILIEKLRRKNIDEKDMEIQKVYTKQFLFSYIYKIINYREKYNISGKVYQETRKVSKEPDYKYGGEE
jgi:hypothetical protein